MTCSDCEDDWEFELKELLKKKIKTMQTRPQTKQGASSGCCKSRTIEKSCVSPDKTVGENARKGEAKE